MPRVTLNPLTPKRINAGAVISYKMALLSKDNASMAKCLGKTERTLRSYAKTPDSIRLGDLWKLEKFLQLTDEEIVKIVRGR